MSLEDWLKANWLTRHSTSRREIEDLLAVADRDLKASGVSGLDDDWRLAIGYNAALRCATAALAACGYRPARGAQHHYLIQSLAHTIGAEPELVAQLDAFRKKRNMGDYERAGLVSAKEAAEMIALAHNLRERAQEWLQAKHPELL